MLAVPLHNALLRYLSLLFVLITMLQPAQGQNNKSVIDTTDYLPYPEGINTNLMIAAVKGYTSEVHRLIKLGADVDATDIENTSPLIYAVANNNLTTAKALLSHNARTDIFTSSGESALHIAAKDNLPDIAEALIRAGTDINLKDHRGAMPLHYASAYGYFSLCDLLLYYNADIEARTEDGSTPLILAVYGGHAAVCDLLLQHGALPGSPDNKGFTPFITAAQNNDTLIMNLLIDAGTDIYATNEYNFDAFDMAIRNNHHEAYSYLKKRVDPAMYKKTGIASPFMIARKYGRTEILEELKKAGFPQPDKLNFDRVKLQAGIKTSIRDYYTCIGLSIKDPVLKIMINAGFELKPAYNKVLVKYSENSYYQYYDKRYIIYTGAGKEFRLYESFSGGGSYFMDLHLNFGYMMAEKYKGTNIKPDDKLKIMPRAVLRWTSGNFNLFVGYEYMKTDLYRIGPNWFTIGFYYDIYFDKTGSPLKTIKWY